MSGRSVLRRAGRAAGYALAAVPVAGAAALAAAGSDDASALELLASVPRTLRMVGWGLRTAFEYRSLSSRYAAVLPALAAGPGAAQAAAGGGAAVPAAAAAAGESVEAYRRELSELHLRAARRLLLACQASGSLYIKAGQLAVSLRAVPPEYRSTLEALQDAVPPRPFSAVERALVRELGAPLAELFASFDPSAVAAASLAQVHRATTHDGRRVAVKIQYPGLEAAVGADLATMSALFAASHWLFPDTDWRWLAEELRRQLASELDFRREAANARRLEACLAARRDVAVPQVVPQLSSRRVLTAEWVDGCKVTDIGGLERMGLAPRAVGVLLLDAFAEMTLVHGWTHGDPHPGNILVRRDPRPRGLLRRLLPAWAGGGPRAQLVLLDHGVYVHLPPRERGLYCQLWCTIVLGDRAGATEAATALAGPKAGRILPDVLRPRDWTKATPEERRRVRQEAGIDSFGDLARVLESAPRSLVDSLRVSAVVRHSAALLGVGPGERLRINAGRAWEGARRGGAPLVQALRGRWARLRLRLRVFLMRTALALLPALE